MKCLVTGATGFIGAHLVRWLIQQEYQVGVFVRPSSTLWRLQDIVPRLHIISGDLFEISQSAPSIRRFAPEIVYHLGWSAVGDRRRDDLVQIQNVNGSLSLLQLARESGCRHWVGLGSQAEYGRYDSAIAESWVARPETLYGIAKLSVALLSQRLCNLYGIRFVWLRLFAAFGPMAPSTFLIPYVISTLLEGAIPSVTAGDQQLDYLFVQDVVEGIWQLAMDSNTDGIFNIGSGQVHTVKEVVECIRDLINPHLRIGFGEVPYYQNQPMHWQADITKLQESIGWKPRTSLRAGLAKTIEWYKAHL